MKISYMLYSHNGLYNQLCSFQTLAGIAAKYKNQKIDAVYSQHSKRIQDPQEEHVDLSSILSKVDNSQNPHLVDFIDFSFDNIVMHENDYFLTDRLNSNIIHSQNTYINCQEDIHENESAFAENKKIVELSEDRNNIFNMTLVWYSRFFYNRTKEIDDAIRSVKFKQEYYDFADMVANNLGRYNSAHTRIMKDHFQYYMFNEDNLRSGLASFEDTNLPLYIAVDDFNNPLICSKIPKENMIHNIIFENFLNDFNSLTYSNTVALGLVTSLIASKARDFVGTPYSTYTAFIHQERCRNDLPSFKFFPKDFDEYDENFLPYSWNSSGIRDTSWQREWKECKLL